MLSVYPDYYPEFKCIASRCRHNCCIGWEIDIDPATVEKYAAAGGEIGARLHRNIAREDDPPHFILGEQERCPFLNGDNLCDLIIHGGEGFLCQICADHPRFRNELPGRVEIGLGLCCEAAAELIIDRREPVGLIVTGETEKDDDEYAAAILALRGRVLAAAQDRNRTITGRMRTVLELCGADFPVKSAGELAELYLGLERLDEVWTGVLEDLARYGDQADLAAFEKHMAGREHEYEQLLVYFIYRHFAGAYDDGDVGGKAAFAVLGTGLLYLLGAVHFSRHGSFTTADLSEYARMYSAEVEYSDNNIDALLEELM